MTAVFVDGVVGKRGKRGRMRGCLYSAVSTCRTRSTMMEMKSTCSLAVISQGTEQATTCFYSLFFLLAESTSDPIPSRLPAFWLVPGRSASWSLCCCTKRIPASVSSGYSPIQSHAAVAPLRPIRRSPAMACTEQAKIDGTRA